MARCDYCGSRIFFSEKREGDLRCCNDECLERGRLVLLSRQVPENIVRESLWKTHQGRCPKCQGPGPVDVHVSHQVWSALLLTTWRSIPQVSCRSCGTKSQLMNAAFSLLLGWWGFPWGFVMTPIQIGRNIAGMLSRPDPSKPSERLEKAIRTAMVRNALEARVVQQASAASSL